MITHDGADARKLSRELTLQLSTLDGQPHLPAERQDGLPVAFHVGFEVTWTWTIPGTFCAIVFMI